MKLVYDGSLSNTLDGIMADRVELGDKGTTTEV